MTPQNSEVTAPLELTRSRARPLDVGYRAIPCGNRCGIGLRGRAHRRPKSSKLTARSPGHTTPCARPGGFRLRGAPLYRGDDDPVEIGCTTSPQGSGRWFYTVEELFKGGVIVHNGKRRVIGFVKDWSGAYESEASQLR